MAMIGDSKYHLNWVWYQYEQAGVGAIVAGNQHPNNIDEETRPSKAGAMKPELLYTDTDLLWAIHNAESLEDLQDALRANRERLDTVEGWEIYRQTEDDT